MAAMIVGPSLNVTVVRPVVAERRDDVACRRASGEYRACRNNDAIRPRRSGYFSEDRRVLDP